MKKLIWIFAFVLIVASSCSKSKNFSVNGNITNAQTSTIYLEKLELDKSVPFDSAKIDKKGNFKLTGSVNQPTFFILKLNDQKFVTLLIDSLEDISLSADYINFASEYKVSGSYGSQKVKELSDHLAKTNTKIDSISSLLNLCAGNPNYEVQKHAWIAEIDAVYRNQMAYSRKFITDNPFSLASLLAIYQKFNNDEYVVQDLQTIKVAASALHSMYPNSNHAQTLYNDTEKMIKNLRNQEVHNFIQQYGQNTPEVILPDINGRNVSLSSLIGKTVLVQFWSAENHDSRVFNTVLKENYSKFKSKGFEIYQISIDENEAIWKQAIEQDGLNWINVCDRKGSTSAITSFNISQIPYNYLLGKDGSIIAKDLKGPAINKKLNEILN